MQNPIQKFRQSFIAFEKPSIYSGKWKTLTSSNYRRIEYFLLGFCTPFSYLPMSTKRSSGFILFCLDLDLFAKITKDLVSAHSLKPLLLITQDLNDIKKFRTAFCGHC